MKTMEAIGFDVIECGGIIRAEAKDREGGTVGCLFGIDEATALAAELTGGEEAGAVEVELVSGVVVTMPEWLAKRFARSLYDVAGKMVREGRV